jgi:hypothetical protein
MPLFVLTLVILSLLKQCSILSTTSSVVSRTKYEKIHRLICLARSSYSCSHPLSLNHKVSPEPLSFVRLPVGLR